MDYLLILLGVLTRLLPHPPNMTAVGAVGLFSGSYGPKRWFWVVPLVAMVLSDLVLGFYTWQVMTSVYLSFLVTASLGYRFARRKRTLLRMLGVTICSSIIFYVVTNFAVWAWTPMYQKHLGGLLQSYVMAIPFFRNSLFGDFIYTSILFGAYELYRRNVFRSLSLNKTQQALTYISDS